MPRADRPVATRKLRIAALVLLLIVMMWSNLFKNAKNWTSRSQIPHAVFGLHTTGWLLAIGVLLTAVAAAAVVRQNRTRLSLSPPTDFGRAQLLFLIVMWVPMIGAFSQASRN